MSKRRHSKGRKLEIEYLYEKKPMTVGELKRPDMMKITLPGGGLYFLEYGRVLRKVDEGVEKVMQGRKL